MEHDPLCDMHGGLNIRNLDCTCLALSTARSEGYAQGYADCLKVIAAQQGMRISRNATDTQRAAVKTTMPRSGTKGAYLWSLFIAAGEYGLTDDEIEIETGWTHQSASAARNGLMTRGLLTDSGQRRKNRRGLACIVWTPLSPATKDPNDRPTAHDSTHAHASGRP